MAEVGCCEGAIGLGCVGAAKWVITVAHRSKGRLTAQESGFDGGLGGVREEGQW